MTDGDEAGEDTQEEKALTHHSYKLGRSTLPAQAMYIYAMGCLEYIKVGKAGDVTQRRAEIQTGNPNAVHVIAKYWVPAAGASRAERMAHVALSEFRHKGEWFRCDGLTARNAIRDAVIATRATFAKNLDKHAERERLILQERAKDLLANSVWLEQSAAEGRPIAVKTLASLKAMASGDFRPASIPDEVPSKLTRTSLNSSLRW